MRLKNSENCVMGDREIDAGEYALALLGGENRSFERYCYVSLKGLREFTKSLKDMTNVEDLSELTDLAIILPFENAAVRRVFLDGQNLEYEQPSKGAVCPGCEEQILSKSKPVAVNLKRRRDGKNQDSVWFHAECAELILNKIEDTIQNNLSGVTSSNL